MSNGKSIALLKRLIHEAVVHAIRQEVPKLLNEHVSKQGKTLLTEGEDDEWNEVNFNSTDAAGLPKDVRSALAMKMGATFGHSGAPMATAIADANPLLKISKTDKNPYLGFIVDAGMNMSAQDRAGLANIDN